MTVPSCRRPTYPHPFFVGQGSTREKEEQARKKTETHTRAKAGRKCMPRRRASQRRVEERVKGDEATEEKGDSQQPSKGRAQGRGDVKQTASPTPQRSTREGGTRGTGTAQARHTPHTPTSAPTARGQRAPAAGPEGGQQQRGAPEPRRPSPTPWFTAPHRAREPQGQCRASTPAHARPHYAAGGPRQPARRAGSPGRGSA